MKDPQKDSRTHKPTAKRIKEFRKRGEIAMSKDITSMSTVAGGAFAGLVFAGVTADAMNRLMRGSLAAIAGDIDVDVLSGAIMCIVASCVPVALGALAGYIGAATLQLGWPPAFKTPGFNLAKLFSFDSVAQILSPKAMAGRALKSTAKVVFVGFAAALAARAEYRQFLVEPILTAQGLGGVVIGAIIRLGLYAGTALAILAAIDYFVQRRSVMKRMMMTPEELKREHKEQDGDPIVRRRRRQRQRELAQRRLEASVKGADVVLVNPTHYAVALRYRADESDAPVVAAKGRGPIAERIRAIARAAGVPVLSRPPLTRLVHRLVAEGQQVPAQLYNAVAEVLAYVYRLRRRQP